MKVRENAGWRVVLLSMVSLSVAGCAGDKSDLEEFVAAEKARKPGPIEPLPQIKPYETFTYQAQNLRSPFMPDSEPSGPDIDDGGSNTGLQPDRNRNKEYLEQFPLDALDMVGTITSKGEEYALVADPNGAVHRVQPGNYLGQNHGRIISISATEIRVTEIVPDGLGGWMERQAAIALEE